MKLHSLQHVSYEGLGCIGPWARRRGFDIRTSHLYDGAAPPDVGDFDWLVVMGGPMSVGDLHAHPWLEDEKTCIKHAIDEGKTVLGICLGGQLIAEVLGAVVVPNAHREIGWFPVYAQPEGVLSRLLSPQFDAFHWHGDTFGIPGGARHEARSEACLNQAFSYGGRVLSLQFHLEATHESAMHLAENSSGELAAGGDHVQSVDGMLADRGRFVRTNEMMATLLDALADDRLY